MKKFRKILNTILNLIAGASLIVMVILTCWQVFTRYILQNPSTWSEELVSYMFAWSSLFGAAIVSSESGHMNIPILTDKFGVTSQKVFKIFSEIVAFLFSTLILVFDGYKITLLALGQKTSSLGVAVGVFYAVLPICGIIISLYAIINIIDIIKGNSNNNNGSVK